MPSLYVLSNIHNDLVSYNQLIKLYQERKDDAFETIELELRQWFDANLCSVLGGIIDKIKNDGLNEVKFKYLENNIQAILQKNSFLTFYDHVKLHDLNKTTIEYKKLKPSDTRYFSQYLEDELLNRAVFPNMSDAVHEEISASIQEMFINAKMHSETEYIYTCGQFHPKRNELNFTIADTGIGFAKRIEKDFHVAIDSSDAIKWAMIDGHTTKKGVSGGLGLALLKEFIAKNHGKIQIVSGDAFYEFSHQKETVMKLNYFFDGAVVSMTFKTNDTRTYKFTHELEELF